MRRKFRIEEEDTVIQDDSSMDAPMAVESNCSEESVLQYVSAVTSAREKDVMQVLFSLYFSPPFSLFTQHFFRACIWTPRHYRRPSLPIVVHGSLSHPSWSLLRLQMIEQHPMSLAARAQRVPHQQLLLNRLSLSDLLPISCIIPLLNLHLITVAVEHQAREL